MEQVRTLAVIEAELAAAQEALQNVHGQPTEVYARIVGYYRSVRNWNRGKREEYAHRRMFEPSHIGSKAAVTHA
jgi:ribonucleoside-triphosphate reductase